MNDFTWLPCSRDDYMDALNIVSPAAQEAGMFLVGEPVDHEGTYQHCRNFARFKVYRRIAEEMLGEVREQYFVGSEPITKPAFYLLSRVGLCEPFDKDDP